MQFLQATFIPGTLMVSHNCVQLFIMEILSQVRNLKWLINKCEKLFSKLIFLLGQSRKNRASGVSGRIPLCLLAGQKAFLMIEQVATSIYFIFNNKSVIC